MSEETNNARAADDANAQKNDTAAIPGMERGGEQVRIRVARLNMGEPLSTFRDCRWEETKFPQPEFLTCKLKSLKHVSSSTTDNDGTCDNDNSAQKKPTWEERAEIIKQQYLPVLPDKPECPQSLYLYYQNDELKRLRGEKNFSMREASSSIGRSYMNLSAEGRKKYEDLRAREELRYANEMELYNKHVSEVKDRLEQERQAKSKKRKVNHGPAKFFRSRIDLFLPELQLKILKYAAEMDMVERRQKLQILLDHYFKSELPGITPKLLFDEYETNEHVPEEDRDYSNAEKIESYTRSFFQDYDVLECVRECAPRVEEELPNVIQASFHFLNWAIRDHMDYGCAVISKVTFYDINGDEEDILMFSVSTDGESCDIFYDSITFEFIYCSDENICENIVNQPMEVALDALREEFYGRERMEEEIREYIRCDEILNGFYEEWMAEEEARQRSSIRSLWDLEDMKSLRDQIKAKYQT